MTIEEAWEAIDEQTVLTDSSADKIRILALAVLEEFAAKLILPAKPRQEAERDFQALRAKIKALGT